jgi:hypothetical protein
MDMKRHMLINNLDNFYFLSIIIDLSDWFITQNKIK